MTDKVTEMIAAATARARALAVSQGKEGVVERFDRVQELAEALIRDMREGTDNLLFVEVVQSLDRREACDMIMFLVNEVSMRRKAQEVFDAREGI